MAAFKPMKLNIGPHIVICKTSNRTKGFCAATLRHGDIRNLVVRAFLQSIMNFVSPARNEAISREILLYIPVHTFILSTATCIPIFRVSGCNRPSISSTQIQSHVQEYSTAAQVRAVIRVVRAPLDRTNYTDTTTPILYTCTLYTNTRLTRLRLGLLAPRFWIASSTAPYQP